MILNQNKNLEFRNVKHSMKTESILYYYRIFTFKTVEYKISTILKLYKPTARTTVARHPVCFKYIVYNRGNVCTTPTWTKQLESREWMVSGINHRCADKKKRADGLRWNIPFGRPWSEPRVAMDNPIGCRFNNMLLLYVRILLL